MRYIIIIVNTLTFDTEDGRVGLRSTPCLQQKYVGLWNRIMRHHISECNWTAEYRFLFPAKNTGLNYGLDFTSHKSFSFRNSFFKGNGFETIIYLKYPICFSHNFNRI